MWRNAVQRLGLGVLLLSFLCIAHAAKTNGSNGQSLTTWLRSMRAKRNDESLNSDRVWTLADAIPGEPERDYPIYSEIPETDFSCNGRKEGYYADIGARCQVFRICANTANNTAKGFAFLCPNGTLFNQEFFVCDWYRNVNCENSENFYGLNDQIGKTMDSYSKNELMNSAREIIMFPEQNLNLNPGKENLFNNYPTEMGSSLGINRGTPSRGSSNLGQPTSAFNNPSNSYNPISPSGVIPQGIKGDTVYVNSLGQLSTDTDAGFDPKKSFILKPDKSSTFDKNLRVPSNPFDTIKGIENSYSFGFDESNAPIRGSADLSEPVDPYDKDQYLPPFFNGQNPKQLYTYPHDTQSNGPTNNRVNVPDYTRGSNPNQAGSRYQAPQTYSPNSNSQAPKASLYQAPKTNNQFQSPQSSQSKIPQTQPAQNNRYQQANGLTPSGQQQPQRLYQQPNSQSPAAQSPQKLYQQPNSQPSAVQAQPQRFYQQPNTQSSAAQAQPQKLYQQPNYQQKNNPIQSQAPQRNQNSNSPASNRQQNNVRPNNNYQQQPFASFSQQPQPFKAPQAERRQYNIPQNNLIGNRNGYQSQPTNGYQSQPLNTLRNGAGGNKQSNEEYLRGLLKDQTHVHNNKGQLVELIQRLFVPTSTQTRVVSADVVPSPARESYSFTYDGEHAGSNINSKYRPANSGNHQHTGTCGHAHQGYIY